MFDPEVLQILGLNLMAGKSPNFAENLGNAGLATMQYQRQREEDKYRKEERDFLKQQREMQIQELQRQQRMRQEQDNLYRQFVQPGQPSRPYVDTLGDQPPQGDIPAVPPKMDVEGYMAALPMLGPQGIEMAAKLRKDMNDYISVPEGGTVFNKSTGQNVFSNPKIQKPDLPTGFQLNPTTGRWEINPEYRQFMLDKARAGSPSVSVSADRSFGSNFSELLAKDMMETIKAGQAAGPRVDAARRVLDLLQKQPITGTGATFMANLQGAMAQAGLLSGDRQQQLEATQALVTELASQTLAAIRTSGLGAGQGFTNTDRDFLEKASGGKIDMTAAQLERIATLNARAGLASIQAANNAIQRARQMPGYSDQNFPLREFPMPNLPKVINW